MSRVLPIALILASCRHPAPAPATTAPPPPPPAALVDAAPLPLDRDLARLAERATRLYQDVAAAFASSGVDCAGATTKLGTLQRTYADVVAANAKVLHESRANELRAALESHADVLDAVARSIVESPTMKHCSADHAFTDAFDALVGAPP